MNHRLKPADQLQRYLFEHESIRGELVQLHSTYQAIINANPDYPMAIKTLLGELLAATCLLTATLKFTGTVTVQLQGDGPVSLLVINASDQQQMRGVARWNKEISLSAKNGFKALLGKGQMVITLTPEQGERYQGVVGLERDTLADSLCDYFLQSEQLNTELWLRADPMNGQCGGLLLQTLPQHEAKPSMQSRQRHDSESTLTPQEQALADFNELSIITGTIKNEELFSLTPNEILYRLYHEYEVRLYEPQPVSFICSCSREKSEAALLHLTHEETTEMLDEQAKLTLHCDYCGSDYTFTETDIAQIQGTIIRKH